MNVDLAQELLSELGSSLENLETQHAALLQFLKDNEIVTDDQFAPYLARAENASSVRWRAARIRLESLFRNERQKEENEQPSTGAGEAPTIKNREEEPKTQEEAGSANAAPHSEGTQNGTVQGAGEQSTSEKNDKNDERATREDHKRHPPSKTT